jgi:hypothetical protein
VFEAPGVVVDAPSDPPANTMVMSLPLMSHSPRRIGDARDGEHGSGRFHIGAVAPGSSRFGRR